MLKTLPCFFKISKCRKIKKRGLSHANNSNMLNTCFVKVSKILHCRKIKGGWIFSDLQKLFCYRLFWLCFALVLSCFSVGVCFFAALAMNFGGIGCTVLRTMMDSSDEAVGVVCFGRVASFCFPAAQLQHGGPVFPVVFPISHLKTTVCWLQLAGMNVIVWLLWARRVLW